MKSGTVSCCAFGFVVLAASVFGAERVSVSKTEIDLGEVLSGRSVMRRLEVRNTGDDHLLLSRILAQEGLVATVSDDTIPRGQSRTLFVELTPSSIQGVFNREFELETSDPTAPTVRFVVKGRVLDGTSESADHPSVEMKLVWQADEEVRDMFTSPTNDNVEQLVERNDKRLRADAPSNHFKEIRRRHRDALCRAVLLGGIGTENLRKKIAYQCQNSPCSDIADAANAFIRRLNEKRAAEAAAKMKVSRTQLISLRPKVDEEANRKRAEERARQEREEQERRRLERERRKWTPPAYFTPEYVETQWIPFLRKELCAPSDGYEARFLSYLNVIGDCYLCATNPLPLKSARERLNEMGLVEFGQKGDGKSYRARQIFERLLNYKETVVSSVVSGNTTRVSSTVYSARPLIPRGRAGLLSTVWVSSAKFPYRSSPYDLNTLNAPYQREVSMNWCKALKSENPESEDWCRLCYPILRTTMSIDDQRRFAEEWKKFVGSENELSKLLENQGEATAERRE